MEKWKNLEIGEKEELAELFYRKMCNYTGEKRIKVDSDFLEQIFNILVRTTNNRTYDDLNKNVFSKLDLSNINFKNLYIYGLNLEGTCADIDPQLVCGKNLCNANLSGLYLKNKSFDNVFVAGANLSGTNAMIDPQTVKGKSLNNTNLNDLNLLCVSFGGVFVEGTSLNNTGAEINPQDLYNKSLKGTFLGDVSIIGGEDAFDEVDIRGADFSSANIKYPINPQIVKYKSLNNTNLHGQDLSNADFSDVDVRGANLSNTNAKIDPQLVYCKSLDNADLSGLDLSDADFNDVDVEGANLENTNSIIYLNKLNGKKLNKCNFDGCVLIGNFDDYLLPNHYTQVQEPYFETCKKLIKTLF